MDVASWLFGGFGVILFLIGSVGLCGAWLGRVERGNWAYSPRLIGQWSAQPLAVVAQYYVAIACMGLYFALDASKSGPAFFRMALPLAAAALFFTSLKRRRSSEKH